MKVILHNGVSHLCLFVAGNDIDPGTELTYYYGPTDAYMYWRMVSILLLINLLFLYISTACKITQCKKTLQ